MSKFDTTLFDLNGVLILDKPGYVSSDLEKSIYKRLGTVSDDKTELDKILRELNWTEQRFWEFNNQAWSGAIPNLELITIIKKLKRLGFKTGLITNTSGLSLRKGESDFFGLNLEEIFDTVVISSEVHLLKPGIEIYNLALDNLHSKPETSIFIDDSQRYLNGAISIGITPILYLNNQELISRLNNLLDLDLDGIELNK